MRDIQKYNELQEVFAQALNIMGYDLEDEDLVDTPKRIAKMWVYEMLANEHEDFEGLKTFPNENGYNEIIMADRISFASTCIHHFLPFQGMAWIAYVPDKRFVGASKLARVLEHYAARAQLQERLTEQTAKYLNDNLKPKGVAVVIRAIHGCMSCRGIKKKSGGFVTSSLHGVFMEKPEARQELFDLISLSKHF